MIGKAPTLPLPSADGWFWILGLLALCAALAYARRPRPMRLVTIIDGDTFMAVDTRGRRRKLRLADVDCPELSQRNGQEARDFVRALTRNTWVSVKLRGRDRYGRHLARIRVAGEDLGHALVKAGLAYPLISGGRYRFAALQARLARRGVHKGFGQAKPWEAASRSSWLGRKLHRRRTSALRSSRDRRKR